MTGDTKTSVYILNGDALQDKNVLRASAIWDKWCADKGSVVRVEREHCKATLLLHLGNV